MGYFYFYLKKWKLLKMPAEVIKQDFDFNKGFLSRITQLSGAKKRKMK